MRPEISKKSKFTLIELLVVIGIIGILAAIILPAIAGVMHQARVLDAKDQARQIQLAVESYISHYEKLPINETGTDTVDIEVDSNLLGILDGNNSRKKRLLANNGTFKNPWNGSFFISLDGDHDNQVNADGKTVAGSVAVYTKYNGELMNSWEK